MLKRIINLMVLVILIFTVNIIPINTAVFELDFGKIFGQNEPETVETVKTMQYSLTGDSHEVMLIDPSSYTVYVDLSRPLNAAMTDLLTLSLEVTSPNGEVVFLEKTPLSYQHTASGLRYTLKADLKAASKALTKGNYLFKLTTQVGNETLEESLDVYLAPSGLGAIGLADRPGQMSFYYYPVTDHPFNVPICRTSLGGSNTFRQIANTLKTPPDLPGFKQADVYPDTDYIWYSSGLLELKYSSSRLEAYQDKAVGELALKAMVQTLAHTRDGLIVNKLRLLIDNQRTSTAFGGLSLAEDFTVEASPSVYLPWQADGKMYWVPQTVSVTEDLTQSVNNMLNIMKMPPLVSGKHVFQVLLPMSPEVTKATLLGSTLKIEVNDAFKDAFVGDKGRAEAFMEGFALSLSTLDFVEQIELYHDQNKLLTLGPASVPSPLIAPGCFNTMD